MASRQPPLPGLGAAIRHGRVRRGDEPPAGDAVPVADRRPLALPRPCVVFLGATTAAAPASKTKSSTSPCLKAAANASSKERHRLPEQQAVLNTFPLHFEGRVRSVCVARTTCSTVDCGPLGLPISSFFRRISGLSIELRFPDGTVSVQPGAVSLRGRQSPCPSKFAARAATKC